MMRFSLALLCAAIIVMSTDGRPVLSGDALFIDQLSQHQLWHRGVPLRLHLGCGENHLAGYINIDFPSSEHTVQEKSGADIFGDVTQLLLSAGSLDEVRLHHLFEHFERQTALALLCQWSYALKKGGVLLIETPDFEGSIDLLRSSSLTYQQKQVVMRHVFGSHEARWAIHCDGWYKEKFEHILQELGFGALQFKFTQYYNLKNIIVSAQKVTDFSLEELIAKACMLLRENMVDNTEQVMLNVWCSRVHQVRNQVR